MYKIVLGRRTVGEIVETVRKTFQHLPEGQKR